MSVTLRLLSILLFPLVFIYTFFIYIRNRLYDLKILKTCQVRNPVISVGNIQIGGTGKTPMVEYLSGLLSDAGIQIVILSRGYRRKSKKPILVDHHNRGLLTPALIGDEPFQLLQNLPGIIIGIDADRCRMAKIVENKYPEAVILLDDGFQHRKIKRDLDIVLIDPDRWSGFPLLFPATFFRDVKSSLKRADLFVINQRRSRNARYSDIPETIGKRYGKAEVRAGLIPVELVSARDQRGIHIKKLRGKNIAAFAGIGNPSRFFDMLKSEGARLVYMKRFPDHHFYTQTELEKIGNISLERNAEFIVTTQKDTVKILEFPAGKSPEIFYLKAGFKFEDDEIMKKHLFAKILLK